MKDNFNEDYFGPDNDYEEQAASDELENFKITWRDNSLFRFFKELKPIILKLFFEFVFDLPFMILFILVGYFLSRVLK